MTSISIVIPAYNEEAFIGELLTAINKMTSAAPQWEWDIVVVDDGSQDRTADIARSFADVTVISQPNQGKGAAVRNGVAHTSADYVLVQDGDLEYDPDDIPRMLAALETHRPMAVYGSRTVASPGRRFPRRTPGQSLGPYCAGLALSAITGAVYHRWITDTLTGYKIYRREDFLAYSVDTAGFETDHELTAKLLRSNVEIVEVPVKYRPRSKEEGKKIRPRDGFIASKVLWRYRKWNPPTGSRRVD